MFKTDTKMPLYNQLNLTFTSQRYQGSLLNYISTLSKGAYFQRTSGCVFIFQQVILPIFSIHLYYTEYPRNHPRRHYDFTNGTSRPPHVDSLSGLYL